MQISEMYDTIKGGGVYVDPRPFNASPGKLFFIDKNLRKCIHINMHTYFRIECDANRDHYHGICNGTIGVVIDVNPTDEYVRVASSVRGSIIDIDVGKQIQY